MNRFIIFITLLVTSQLGAQNDTTKIQLNQVEVIKSFEANLEDAQKVTIKSVLPVQKPFSPAYKYDITIVPIELKYPDPQIKPLAMNPDSPFKVNKGYIIAGYGILKNPDVMAGYHTSKKDTYDAGIHLDFSALDNSNKNPYQKYSNLSADVYGSYMIKENTKLYGGVKFANNNRYFYHTDLNVSDTFSADASKRTLNTIDVKAGITNAERTKYNINYDLNLALKSFNMDNTDARESMIALAGHGEKHVGEATVFMLDGRIEQTAMIADSSINLFTTKLVPSIKTEFGNFIVNVGLNYIYDGNKQSALFPEVLLSYGIVGPNLQIFVGTTQDYFINNLRNTAAINPWLSTDISSVTNAIRREYFGGVKGQFSFLNYQIKGGYKQISNQVFMLNNRSDLRYFDMITDDLNVVFLSGNLDFAITDNITLGGWLTQNVFDLNILENAWHLPNLEANAYTKISLLENKLKIKGELFFNDKVDFINKDGEITKSNVLFDLNASVEYKFTEKFGAFVRGINLLDNKYERWYGYPSVGINGMVGVSVVF